jgi:hypothetical protein
MAQEEVLELLGELTRNVEQNGYKRTLNLLKSQTKKPLNKPEGFSKEIIDVVLSHFSMTFEQLILVRYNRGDNKYVIGFCVYYLYGEMTLGSIHRDIFPTVSKSLLSRYKQLIMELNPKFDSDKKYCQVKSNLDKEIRSNKT